MIMECIMHPRIERYSNAGLPIQCLAWSVLQDTCYTLRLRDYLQHNTTTKTGAIQIKYGGGYLTGRSKKS